MVGTCTEEEHWIFVWRDTEVGTGRQEIERKTNEEINGCSERGREVTQCGERG